MALYLHDEGSQLGQIGTNTGWGNLSRWLVSVGGTVCERFVEEGEADIARLMKELTELEEPEDPDVVRSLKNLKALIAAAEGDRVFVSDGMVGDDYVPSEDEATEEESERWAEMSDEVYEKEMQGGTAE